MKEKVRLIFFEPGQQAEHEGETFVAEAKDPGALCAGSLASATNVSPSRVGVYRYFR